MSRLSSRLSPAIPLATVAAVLYNAWLLGFALDPDGLHGSYVSALEAPGRPHAEVFVVCDIVTGAAAVLAGLLLRRRRALAGAGLVVFGVGNVVEATIPISARCATSVAACGTGLGQVLSPHDIASVVSVLGLALALASVRQVGGMRTVIGIWVVAALFLVFSVLTATWVIAAQAVFLGACGMALVAVPMAVRIDVRMAVRRSR
jgi:hypothetical protein